MSFHFLAEQIETPTTPILKHLQTLFFLPPSYPHLSHSLQPDLGFKPCTSKFSIIHNKLKRLAQWTINSQLFLDEFEFVVKVTSSLPICVS